MTGATDESFHNAPDCVEGQLIIDPVSEGGTIDLGSVAAGAAFDRDVVKPASHGTAFRHGGFVSVTLETAERNGAVRPLRSTTHPQAMAWRSSEMNVSLSHAPRKVGGVVSVASAARPARMAGLWQ